MEQNLIANDSFLIENALTEFIHSAAAANKKAQKIRQNMEYRRKLELRMEEMRLRRETCEFEFEVKK
ncbi:PA3496 family putative envelope integrity protein [Cellvibrio sp. PSBB006]|jgi:hypothetical protein|uniref:PA3496 family putative envelope integrity protein n=1 Tax=Cellvibrio sp. PSBB006 TaxID=1987723 RepID=UPI000B3B68B3|nr:hypothetical protein [Cellvibrio sp. PSBB006]ARU26863.1 hypothetical protein CBR65_05135 [Cellvibrio sp. PSBB006]